MTTNTLAPQRTTRFGLRLQLTLAFGLLVALLVGVAGIALWGSTRFRERVARELGLGLSQQAKIATAISTIARALISTPGSTIVQLWVHGAPSPAFVLSCRFVSADQPDKLVHLEQSIRFDETPVLVDEAVLSADEYGILISLRMWLNR